FCHFIFLPFQFSAISSAISSMSQRRNKLQPKALGQPQLWGLKFLWSLDGGAWCFVLLLLFLATYLPSIGNQFVNYVDGVYVIANIHVQGGFSLESLRWAFGNYEVGNWHPLTW